MPAPIARGQAGPDGIEAGDGVANASRRRARRTMAQLGPHGLALIAG
jgi:hypothetical protein